MTKVEGQVTLQSMLGTDQEIVYAILLQNALHPKNANRVEAIKDGSYVEIRTVEEARKFLSSLLETNLKNELLGIQSAC